MARALASYQRFGEVDNVTVSPQPIEVHVPHFFRVIIHQPDGGPPPPYRGFATVFVGDCECVLSPKPSFICRKKLEVSLDIVKYRILGVFQPRLQVVHIPLQAAVYMWAQ